MPCEEYDRCNNGIGKLEAYLNNVMGMQIFVFVMECLKVSSVFKVLQVKTGVAFYPVDLLEMQHISILGCAKDLMFLRSHAHVLRLTVMLWYSPVIRPRILFPRTLILQLHLKLGKYVINSILFSLYALSLLV